MIYQSFSTSSCAYIAATQSLIHEIIDNNYQKQISNPQKQAEYDNLKAVDGMLNAAVGRKPAAVLKLA